MGWHGGPAVRSLAWDTYANNDHALDVNSDAIAYSELQYAMNTSYTNDVRGKGSFPAVSGGTSEASTGTGSHGGLHDTTSTPPPDGYLGGPAPLANRGGRATVA